jgi:scyllo-inositol 2-dehydrogenase (NADP+)
VDYRGLYEEEIAMLNMGILGMGKMADFHADWILKNKDMNLVAVCKKRKDRVDEIKSRYGVEVYLDVDDFLSIDKLDFVVITTTNDVHEELTIRALEKKKNVIVEKPMSVDYEGALRMIKAAEHNKKHLFVHQSSRWDRDFLLLREIKKSGLIGDYIDVQSRVILCDAFWPSWGIDGMADPWRIKAEKHGGMLLDWGPHLVDQVLLLMDQDPIDVYGLLQGKIWTTEVDDHFFAVLRFENDVFCQIEASNNGRIPLPRWHVIGSKGTLEVKGKSEPFWDEAKIVYITKNGKKETQSLKFHDICESGAEGGFYDDLVPYLKGERPEFVSMYEGAKVMRVLDLIRESNHQKRSVPY